MPPLLRVLEVFEPPQGGVPEHVRVLSEGLLDRDMEPTVAGPADAPVRDRLEARGIPYVELPIVGDMLALSKDAPSLQRIFATLRRGRFDVVHGHSQKAGLLARVAAPPTRTPAVYTPHSLVHRFMFVPPGERPRSLYYKTLWMERLLGRATAAFIAVSEEERQAAIDDRLITARRVHVILNGVPFDDAIPPDPRLVEFRGEGPLVGMVAALRLQKGLPTLLDALELLASRGTPARVAIVGSGPLEREVRERVAAGPLADTTLVLPFDGRVEPYLRALDAFVLASYWEGMPLAVLEAMAAGLPVVATDSGGTAEAVVNGDTGLLVPVNDAEALADALSRIVAEPEERARMGTAARARYEARFQVDPMVDRTAALYRAVARR